MKFFLSAICCRLKLSFTGTLIAAALVFMVFLAFVAIAFSESQQLTMNVGVFHSDTAYAKGLVESFKQYATDTLSIIRYPELEPMLKDVANGQLECAYVLPHEYVRDNTIEMFVTPDTIGAGVSNLLLASTYMRDMAADLGYKVLKNYIPDSKKDISAIITEKNLTYLSLGAFMDVDYNSVTGRSQRSENNLFYALNGTVALFSWLITMLFCLSYIREGRTALAMRLKTTGVGGVYFLANVTAIFILNLAFFTAAGIAIGVYFHAWAGVGVVCAYAFFVSVLGVSLGCKIKSESLFLGFIILSFLSAAVLSGIFLDIRGVVPRLDGIKYLFPTYYFMDGLRGSNAYAILAMSAAVLAGAMFAMQRKV